MRRTVSPDRPTIRIDAGVLDRLPDDMRRALEALYTEQEQERARAEIARAEAYQASQAACVEQRGGWWPVDCGEWDRAKEHDAVSSAMSGVAEEHPVVTDDGIYTMDLRMTPTAHQFYHDLYGIEHNTGFNDLDVSILVNHRDRHHPYQMYSDYGEFRDGIEKETSFIYMGTFWVPPSGYLTAKANAMITIGGFCVDIDRVDDVDGQHFSAEYFMTSLFDCLESNPEIMPNYLMLSGTGVQLWYVFGRAIPLLSKKAPRRAKYNELLKLLYDFFDDRLQPNLFKVDTACAHINCALRAPGSPAKKHYPTRLFAYGGVNRDLIDPLRLSAFLGGKLQPYDVEDWDQERYQRIRDEEKAASRESRKSPATEKQLAYIDKLHKMGCLSNELYNAAGSMSISDADFAIKMGETTFVEHSQWIVNGGNIKTSAGHLVKRKPRDRSLYDYTLARIPRDTPPGSRYWSLFGLAGLAWNCCVPRREVERDMIELLESEWAKHTEGTHDGKPLTVSDVRAALTGYNELGCLRTRDQLESHLKWNYAPPQLRNGRDNWTHLWGDWYDENGSPVLNKAKAARMFVIGSPDRPQAKKRHKDAVDRLSEYLSSHPWASKRAAAKALKMSPTTVQKYWAEACETSGIEDTRSGNHSPIY